MSESLEATSERERNATQCRAGSGSRAGARSGDRNGRSNGRGCRTAASSRAARETDEQGDEVRAGSVVQRDGRYCRRMEKLCRKKSAPDFPARTAGNGIDARGEDEKEHAAGGAGAQHRAGSRRRWRRGCRSRRG